MNNPNSPFSGQMKIQQEAAIEECRNWIRGWEADQEKWYFGFLKKKYDTIS